MTIPKFSDLQRPDDTGFPLSWGIWGDEDQLGMLNNISEEATSDSAKLVRRGVRFNLDLPLHLPYSLLTPGEGFLSRKPPVHTLDKEDYRTLYVRDDKLDEFYLQGSTQWDGLTHIGTPQIGFYNGVKAEQITFGADTKNGIEHLAEFGIVTRGVLIDLPRYFAKIGREWDPTQRHVATVDQVEACLAEQGVALRQGDIPMFRYGWIEALFAEQDIKVRDGWFTEGRFAGISGEQEMWEFLWDHRVGAVASDSPTCEAGPMEKGRNLHAAIPRLGITLGEMFNLEALAEDCARDGVFECMFTSSPLNLLGGVGSPPNAIAVK